MRTTTTLAMAVGAAALASPAAPAHAGPQSDFQAPLAGHLTLESHMREHRTELAQQRLTRKAWRLARRLADHRNEGFSPVHYRRRTSDDPPAEIADRIRALRRAIKVERRREARARARATGRMSAPAGVSGTAASASPGLEAIAACESGANPATNTGNGFYGKYQFSLATWRSVGGSGNPAQASEAEQNQRAAMLYAREGASPWPHCGR